MIIGAVITKAKGLRHKALQYYTKSQAIYIIKKKYSNCFKVIPSIVNQYLSLSCISLIPIFYLEGTSFPLKLVFNWHIVSFKLH